MIKAFLDRIDTFLALFERYVKVQEEDLERSKARDEEQKIFFARQAEAAENIASSSHAQTTISRKTADVLERSLPRDDDG
jgi:Tfp pilus assembly protein PilO